MSEEEKKAIRDLRNNIQFGLIGDGTSLITNETAGIILNLIEKQQERIDNVKTRLEYYLIGNMSFNEESQKEFEKLLKLLEG